MTHGTIFERLVLEWDDLRHHGQHATSTPVPPRATMTLTTRNTNGGTMSLATIEQSVRNFVEGIPALVKAEADKVMPHVAELADIGGEIAGSELFQTALSVTLGPDDEAFIVGLMKRLDQGAQDAETAVGEPDPATAATIAAGAGVPVQPVVVDASAAQAVPVAES